MSNSESSEKHEKQFKGWWIPARVVYMLEAGDINGKELVLLGTINGLSKQKDGCFASNGYFGKLLGVGEERIRQMLAHLKELKLVRQIRFDGRFRWLKVYWDIEPNGETAKKPPKEIGGGPQGTLGVGSKEKLGVYHNIEEQSLSAPTVTDRPCVSSSPKRKKSKPSKFDFRATDELIRIVSTHVKVNCKSNRNEWANQFRLLREWDGVPKADIRRTLEWYGRHIGEEYVPEAFSAAAFRRKFKDGKFASAMRRSKDEDSCGDEEDREMDIACEVRAWMENNLGWNSNQEAFDEDVDKALEALGYGAGAIDYQYV